MRRTRNPVYGYTVPWVRIPPFPPEFKEKPREFKDLRGFFYSGPSPSPSASIGLSLSTERMDRAVKGKLLPTLLCWWRRVWHGAFPLTYTGSTYENSPTGSKCKVASNFHPVR